MNNVNILYIIDHATSFSATAVITSKRKEGIAGALIAIFGPPCKILSDNGREFNNIYFVN